MKPAELATVAIAVPMIVALLASYIAEGRAPTAQPAVHSVRASELAPAFDEIVVVARRPSST
jgi:hypothetical protein